MPPCFLSHSGLQKKGGGSSAPAAAGGAGVGLSDMADMSEDDRKAVMRMVAEGEMTVDEAIVRTPSFSHYLSLLMIPGHFNIVCMRCSFCIIMLREYTRAVLG